MNSLEDLNDRLLTTYDVGALLQVNPSSVANWVRDGRIPSFRTPGGHHRIRVGDLVGFLNRHQMPVPRSLQTGRRRLLIVDDEPRELRALGRILKPHDAVLEIRTASQGIDALVLVGSFQPDVVLLDVFMAGMNGIEVCRRLKAMDLTAAVKVVISSARLTPDLEAAALEAGAARCLAKPVKVPDLLDVLGLSPAVRAAPVSPDP